MPSFTKEGHSVSLYVYKVPSHQLHRLDRADAPQSRVQRVFSRGHRSATHTARLYRPRCTRSHRAGSSSKHYLSIGSRLTLSIVVCPNAPALMDALSRRGSCSHACINLIPPYLQVIITSCIGRRRSARYAGSRKKCIFHSKYK